MDEHKELSEEKNEEKKAEKRKISFSACCIFGSVPLSMFCISVYFYGFKQVMTAVCAAAFWILLICLLICFPGSFRIRGLFGY